MDPIVYGTYSMNYMYFGVLKDVWIYYYAQSNEGIVHELISRMKHLFEG